MSESIAFIKEQFQAAHIDGLPALISEHLSDERKGVQNIIDKARKRILDYEREELRLWDMQAYERKYAEYSPVCGVDEAGRGPLAGPVVAGAVILPEDCRIHGIDDSKKLSAKKRDELFDIIKREAIAYGVGIIDHSRIDEINILNATYEAMTMAVNALSVKPGILLNDAVTIKGMSTRQIAIVKGDSKSLSIAAASIIAKVTRDRIMLDYDREYPGYGFAAHKGYGSKDHYEALRELGPCPIHRLSFIHDQDISK